MQNLFFSDPYPSTRRAPEETQLKNVDPLLNPLLLCILMVILEFLLLVNGSVAHRFQHYNNYSSIMLKLRKTSLILYGKLLHCTILQ
jgi:hypothetical protein